MIDLVRVPVPVVLRADRSGAGRNRSRPQAGRSDVC